jgi:hypothetical protein
MSEEIMSEEASICPQPRAGRNGEIRVRRFPNLKLGIFQRTMNWCGRNWLVTTLFVIMLIVILVQQLRFAVRSGFRANVLSSMKARAQQKRNITPEELRRFQEALDRDE